MPLSFTPDPTVWIAVPPAPPTGWAASAAESLAAAQGVSDPDRIAWLSLLTADAADRDRGDEDARYLCVTDIRRGGIVLDLDWIDLGELAPDDVEVDEAATGQTEEFVAGSTRGKRIIWVSPADQSIQPPAATDGDPLQGQVLYVCRLVGTGYLITMRSSLHQLDLIVDSVAACEDLLATVSATAD